MNAHRKALQVATHLAHHAIINGYSIAPASEPLAAVTDNNAAAKIVRDGTNDFRICFTTTSWTIVLGFIPWILSRLVVAAEIVVIDGKLVAHVSDNQLLKLVQDVRQNHDRVIHIHHDDGEPETFERLAWPERPKWANWSTVEAEPAPTPRTRAAMAS